MEDTGEVDGTETMQITFADASHDTASTKHRLGIDWIHNEVTGFMAIKYIHAHSEAANYPQLSPGMQLLRIGSVDVPLVSMPEGKTYSRFMGEQLIQMYLDAPWPLQMTFTARVV